MSAFYTAAQYGDLITEEIAKCEAIVEIAKNEGRELTEDEAAQIDNITDVVIPGLKDKQERAAKVQAVAMDHAKALAAEKPPLDVAKATDGEPDVFASVKVPARAAKASKKFENSRDAYASGQFLAALAGNKRSDQWCQDNGIYNAMSEGTDSAGGFTVPTPLSSTIVRLVEEYGLARQLARVVPMSADVLNVPRRTAGLTTYFPAEGASITASDLTFAQATVTAKKYAALAIMSTELDEDSVINMADLVADEIALAFATSEDTNWLIGDGTGTYASVSGFADALAAGATYDAGSGETTVASLDIEDYFGVMALVSKYPGASNAWIVNSATWANSMMPQAYAGGGNTVANFEGGMGMSFLGFPVYISQVLPDDGASNIVAYFGDFSLASTIGTRRGVTMRVLNELYAATDQVGIIATERVGITVHETSGPVACLKLAAT